MPASAHISLFLSLLAPVLFAQADPRVAREQAIANLTIHLCAPPPTQGRHTTGQYFILRSGQITTQGTCRLALVPYPGSNPPGANPAWFDARPWIWIERIAVDYSVSVITRGAPGAGQVAATIIAAQSTAVPATSVAPATFSAATKAFFTANILDAAFPPGIFPDERGMIARGAGQSLPCPGGNVLLIMPGLLPECLSSETVLRLHPITRYLPFHAPGRF